MDFPVVDEKKVRDAPEPLERLRVVPDDRFLAQVRTRHNECDWSRLLATKKQVVEGSVGEHDAKIPVAGSYFLSNRSVILLLKKQNRAGRVYELRFLVRAELCERTHGTRSS